MNVRNQEHYWGVVVDCEPRFVGDRPRGTFLGGPSGTSQAPHLYLSEGKANRRANPGYSKVVKVKLEVVE